MREEATADIKCCNPNCPAQLENHILNFVSRNAMNIKGIGESAVRGLIEGGYVHTVADLYHLSEHRSELLAEGVIGREKNTDKVLLAVENSKKMNRISC